jgi:hypothetical protein
VPDSIIQKVNALGIQNKREKYGRKLEFLDRTKCPYSWTYEEEDDEDELVEYISHPEMAAEVPGVTWASDLPALVDRSNADDDSSDDDSSVDSEDSAGVDEHDNYVPADIDGEFAGVDDELAGVDGEFAGVDGEFAGVDGEFAGVDSENPGVADADPAFDNDSPHGDAVASEGPTGVISDDAVPVVSEAVPALSPHDHANANTANVRRSTPLEYNLPLTSPP